mmetsp:Transcript_48285/g.96670  ORF Transcript_48285/g.96670 Transcript_48285/m.96670 type:complete len:88 (+) Transcript_48285:91-354(+)
MRVLVATVVQNSTKRKNLQIRQRGAALSMVSRAEAQRFAVYEVEYLIIPAATACSADCAFFSTGTWMSASCFDRRTRGSGSSGCRPL